MSIFSSRTSPSHGNSFPTSKDRTAAVGSLFSNKLLLGCLLVAALFYVWLAYSVPYTHDDWDWGLSNGIDQLLHATINSRYSGNLLEVLLTRSFLLKTVIMGFTFLFLPLLSIKVAYPERPLSNLPTAVPLYLMGNLFLLLMPTSIWQQTYGWIAGFSNYVFSALLLICFFWMISDTFQPPVARTHKKRLFSFIGFLLFTCILQLFLENVSLYVFGVCFLLVIYHSIREKKLSLKYSALCIGSFVGLLIMFSSNIYDSLFSSGEAVDGYRQLTISLDEGLLNALYSMFKRFLLELSPQIWSDNWLYCVIISLSMILLIGKFYSHGLRPLRILGIAIHGASMVYFVLNHRTDGFSSWNIPHIEKIQAFLNFAFFLLVTLELFLFLPKKALSQKAKLLFFWLSAPAVIVPMTAINATGPRTFFTSNLFFLLFLMVIWVELFSESSPFFIKGASVVAILASVVVAIYWVQIYSTIDQTTQQRMQIIQTVKENHTSTCVLPSYPEEVRKYLWNPNPVSPWREEYFKQFYGLPQDTILEFQK